MDEISCPSCVSIFMAKFPYPNENADARVLIAGSGWQMSGMRSVRYRILSEGDAECRIADVRNSKCGC